MDNSFVDAVRATGGNNATRYLGISGYCTNPDLTIKHLQLPTDPTKDRLLISVHYYDPANFALENKFAEWGHTGALSKKEKWGDEEHLEKIFAALRTAYVEKGIPVYIGEWGAYTATTTVLKHSANTTWNMYAKLHAPMAWPYSIGTTAMPAPDGNVPG